MEECVLISPTKNVSITKNYPHTLYYGILIGGCLGESPVERINLSDVDETFLHEATEDEEGLGPHVLDL